MEPLSTQSDAVPWGNAIVVRAFVPGQPNSNALRAAEAAVAAVVSDAVETVGWFERLQERPVREETMGQ